MSSPAVPKISRGAEVAFYTKRWLAALDSPEIDPYSPRVKDREGPVDHVSAVYRIPDEIGGRLQRELTEAIARSQNPDLIKALLDGRIRRLPINQYHVTAGWVNWGNSRTDDRQIIDRTALQIPVLQQTMAANGLRPFSYVIDGFGILNGRNGAKQIINTIRGWDPIRNTMLPLRSVAGWEKGGYPLAEDPLTTGQPVQSTGAGLEFIDLDGKKHSIDSRELAVALGPYLPNETTGSMFEIEVPVTGLDIIVHRHNEGPNGRLMGTVDWLGHLMLGPIVRKMPDPRFAGRPEYLEHTTASLSVDPLTIDELADFYVKLERDLGLQPANVISDRYLDAGLAGVFDRLDAVANDWPASAHATTNAQRPVQNFSAQLAARGRAALADPTLGETLGRRRGRNSAGRLIVAAELLTPTGKTDDLDRELHQLIKREPTTLSGPGTRAGAGAGSSGAFGIAPPGPLPPGTAK